MNKQEKSPELGGNPGGRKRSGGLNLLLDCTPKNADIASKANIASIAYIANYHLFALLGQAFCMGEYEIVDAIYDKIRSNQGAA